MAEVRARDAFVRSNMEKLREARLAKERKEQDGERAPARRRG